jgi:hypothetical protein
MALITLDDYKLFEGINSTKNDDQLDALIESTSALIETYCNTKFGIYAGSPGVTDIFDVQWDTHVVQLRYSPIITITSVQERSAYNEAYTTILNTGGKYEWYFDSISDSVIRTNDSGSYALWPKGVGSVKVTYRAGYATLPEDLKLAVVDLVTYYFKDEHRVTRSLGTASTQKQVTSSIRDAGFPDNIKRVLDLYRQP